MRVITRQQGFFDFLCGIEDQYVDIPDSEVEHLTFYGTDY